MAELKVAPETFHAMKRQEAQSKREWELQLLRTKDDCWRIPVTGGWRYVSHEEYAEYNMTGRAPALKGGQLLNMLNENRFWNPLPGGKPLNVYDYFS